ncbi:protein phosphatase 2C domain-containing protein [Streptomyces sp. NPDC023327]|uniref:protein phosphatase 2C domain-containing protein n=1 Tax=Streptomyces sp. NPDC023327 TaxID=3157088 RepID=UPI00340D4A2D
MSQMPQLSACPSCEEPLEPGDLFCGACGYDLSALPARPTTAPAAGAPNGPIAAPAEPATAPNGPSAAPGGPAAAPSAPAAPLDRPVAGPNGPIAAPDRPLVAPNEPTNAPDKPIATPSAPIVPPDRPTAAPGGPKGAADQPGAGADQPGVAADRPEVGANQPEGAANRPEGGADRTAAWPLVPEADGSGAPAPTHLSSDVPGTDSTGGELTAPPGNPLASDAPEAGADPAAGAKLCVACRSGRVDPDGYCENCGHAQPRERDHMEEELETVAAVSDRGLRHHRNEDAFAISAAALPDGSPAVVAIVCDGVSSATRPDEASLAASRAASESLLDSLPRGVHPQQGMHEAILSAADAVNALAAEATSAREHTPHQNAPACTLVGAVVAGSLLVVGWVGDSRAYWVPDDRSGPTVRLTEDDSWAAQMVAAGLMNEAEAYADERAHAITGWLGADAYELEPHTASFKPDRAGVVVVCTDGLWNYAEAVEEMARAVPADAAERPLHSAQVLVGHALDGGGHDNVTVAVVPFPHAPRGAGSA